MHVDGLRFDLASVMGRDYQGNVLVEPPVVEMIAEDAVLSDTKLIAEPWDAAAFIRSAIFLTVVAGRSGTAITAMMCAGSGAATPAWPASWRRVCAAAPICIETSGRSPRHSINFITCHDGFTLWDLVSYNHKHNEANGEGNRDGSDANYSWNCGVEGDTTNPAILGLRRRQARNLLATLFLSQGVPMLLAGDEFLRTQRGNNNAYCQDNETSWVDWSLAVSNSDFLRFVREMIALRKRHPALRRCHFFTGSDIAWHGIEPYRPDFSGLQPQPGADAGRPTHRPRAGSRFLHGVQRLARSVAVRGAAGAAGQALAPRHRHGDGAAAGHSGTG